MNGIIIILNNKNTMKQNNNWQPKPQTYDRKFILQEIKAMDNNNLNELAKIFKNDKDISEAIVKEYNIRIIA
tara:strand:+ start:1040 stop:1255 length:216 start_codon:yes stop_codon:yes gene_type:complete